jgi:hypothetical protein
MTHTPRARHPGERRDPPREGLRNLTAWIPAFAGMTRQQ